MQTENTYTDFVGIYAVYVYVYLSLSMFINGLPIAELYDNRKKQRDVLEACLRNGCGLF